MKSRLRNALVGVTALGMTGIGYVGGKEGLKLVTYPDIVGVWAGCYGETWECIKGMQFTKGQCDSILVDSLVDHETGMRKCLKMRFPTSRISPFCQAPTTSVSVPSAGRAWRVSPMPAI
jgi:Phage lysozyme